MQGRLDSLGCLRSVLARPVLHQTEHRPMIDEVDIHSCSIGIFETNSEYPDSGIGTHLKAAISEKAFGQATEKMQKRQLTRAVLHAY